jgi:hypothetical protein
MILGEERGSRIRVGILQKLELRKEKTGRKRKVRSVRPEMKRRVERLGRRKGLVKKEMSV